MRPRSLQAILGAYNAAAEVCFSFTKTDHFFQRDLNLAPVLSPDKTQRSRIQHNGFQMFNEPLCDRIDNRKRVDDPARHTLSIGPQRRCAEVDDLRLREPLAK